LSRGLSPAPSDRFASMQELLDGLAFNLRRTRRRRAALRATVLLAVGILLAGAWRRWENQEAPVAAARPAVSAPPVEPPLAAPVPAPRAPDPGMTAPAPSVSRTPHPAGGDKPKAKAPLVLDSKNPYAP